MREGAYFVLVAALAASCSGGPAGNDGGADAAPTDAGDAETTGDTSVCASGETRCSDNPVGVETCDTTGQWSAPVACAAQTCVAGVCVGECAVGTTRCTGLDAQTCDATGKWTTTATCPIACCSGACVDTATDTSNCGACGTTCAAGGACGTGFTAFTGTQPAGWTANGNATYDTTNQAGQLTDANVAEAGTWVYGRALTVDDLSVQFDFFSGGGSGADGVGFMLETNGANAVGSNGGGFGMSGLKGFGVEFDEFDNAECLDDNANHSAIDSLTPCGAGVPTSLVVNDAPGFTIGDGAWHKVDVHVVNGAFTVTAESVTQFTSYVPAGWKNGAYYLGFGGSTGGTTNVHAVRNVTVSFTSPHCY